MDNYEGAHDILNGNTQKSFFWKDVKINKIQVQNDEMRKAFLSVDIQKSRKASRCFDISVRPGCHEKKFSTLSLIVGGVFCVQSHN